MQHKEEKGWKLEILAQLKRVVQEKKEFVNNPASVSMLSGLRKPQIRF